jgi:spore coat protein CotF
MNEQAMVTDALNSINSSLKSLSDMIVQTENQELRQTLQQMRNEAETCQYELYTIAKSKNYYQPAQAASQDEIMTVKNFVNQTGQSMMGSQAGQQQGQQAGQQGQAQSQAQGMQANQMR